MIINDVNEYDDHDREYTIDKIDHNMLCRLMAYMFVVTMFVFLLFASFG